MQGWLDTLLASLEDGGDLGARVDEVEDCCSALMSARAAARASGVGSGSISAVTV